MAEHIFVNISKSPYVVCLPSGRMLNILPGHAVQGNYFARFSNADKFVSLPAIPAGFMIKGVSQPLQDESTRGDGNSSVSYGKQSPKREGRKAEPAATVLSVAKGSAGEAEKNVEDVVRLSEGTTIPTTDTFEGLNKDQWIHRIRSISDTTLAQQMKLAQLKGLAVFLNIGSADQLQNKGELTQALRVKVRTVSGEAE